jgi:hypothetical protein
MRRAMSQLSPVHSCGPEDEAAPPARADVVAGAADPTAGEKSGLVVPPLAVAPFPGPAAWPPDPSVPRC